MPNEVALSCLLNAETVPARAEPRLVYLLVDMKPGEGAGKVQVPVNLSIVLDVSESMRLPVLSQAQFDELTRLGQVAKTTSDGVPVWTFRTIPPEIRAQAPSNLEAVQASISASTRHLEARDRVSLVAFANRAEVLLRGVEGSDQRRVLDAVSSLAAMQLGDETELAVGLEAGLREVQRGQSEGMVNRILVLTDGFTLDTDKVMALAQQGREQGAAVSTLGIGTEFNEKLLVEMADASLGNAYFAPSPHQIPPAFEQELAAVQAVTLRDIEVDVKLSVGVELRRAYRVRPAISLVPGAGGEGRATAISLGDLNAANPPSLLLELIVPSQAAGTFRVAHLSVTHSESSQERIEGAACDVIVKYSARKVQGQPNPTVMNTVEKVTAYVLQTRALDDMAAGNMAAATQKLRAAATRLLTVGEPDLAQAAESQAAHLENGGQVSPEGAKELRYATRKLG